MARSGPVHKASDGTVYMENQLTTEAKDGFSSKEAYQNPPQCMIPRNKNAKNN